MEDRIIVHEGVLQSLESFVQNHGKFDVVFIDHVKGLYLSDFLHLERLGAIGVGTTVFGDNIIYPGSPDYLEHLKSHSKYDSVLYHSYLEYSD
jgi:catechol O-methyltransferase